MAIAKQQNIESLPKWAQERIRDLERERDTAVGALRDAEDAQTPSRIWYDDYHCLGEQRGPSNVRHYVQTRKVTFQMGEREVTVGYDNHANLYLSADRGLFFTPIAHNKIEIYAEEQVTFGKNRTDSPA
jgi:hypothetical protein